MTQSIPRHSFDSKSNPSLLANNAAAAAASNDAFLSSGLSPGATVHLIGPGQVGRAFLQQHQNANLRLVAVSDRSGTVFNKQGLSPAAIATHKAAGVPLLSLPAAEAIPTELAIRLVSADIVVDATPSTASDTDAAVQRGRAALQCGASLVLCSKNGLAEAAADWLQPATRARIGVNAVLGGTGGQLLRELDELQSHCQSLALVGNVTTTAIITAVEQRAVDTARRLMAAHIGNAEERISASLRAAGYA